MNSQEETGASPMRPEMTSRLASIASRVAVENRLEEVKGELRFASVTPITARRPRRVATFVGIASVAAASVGVVALIQQRPNTIESQSQPPVRSSPVSSTTLPPAADGQSNPLLPFKLFPVLDAGDVPVSEGAEPVQLYANFATRDQTEGWTSTYITGSAEAPFDVISVNGRPEGSPGYDFPDAKPARRNDVREFAWGAHGGLTLLWVKDGLRFAMAGTNADLMYEFVDFLKPYVATDQPQSVEQGRPQFVAEGDLPGGLSPLKPQFKNEPALFPQVSDEAGRVSVSVDYALALELLLGWPELERVTVGSYDAWMANASDNAPMLAIEVADRETVTISGQDFTREQLLDVARKIRFVDEETWRAHYGVTEYADGGPFVVATTAAVPADSAAPLAVSVAPPATEFLSAPTTTIRPSAPTTAGG